ncbi:MAG: response regulator, partial [Spirulina sp.]
MSNEKVTNLKADILIVDDLLPNLRVLTAMLKEKNYKVRQATDGESAIEAAQIKPPDLILLDIKMPDMDGYEVCQILKSDDRTKEIPVIFISALSEVLDKVKAFEVGGIDYITKPFQEEEVLTRIENQLTIKRQQKLLQQANTELQEQRAFLRTVIDSNPNLIFVKDANGRFLLANQTFADFHGTTVEEIIGKTIAEIQVNSEEVAQFLADDEPAIATGNAQIRTEKAIAATGEIHYFQSIKMPLVTNNSQNTQVLGVATDITTLKAAQLALQESEAKNRAILTAIPDLMFRVTLDGIYLDSFISNKEVKPLFPEDIDPTGRHISEFIPPEIAERHLQAARSALTTGKLQVYQQEVEIAGRVQYEEVRVVPSGQNEVLFIIRNISEKRRAELALHLEQQQSERLLLNILPRSIADRLKVTTGAIAEYHESASILFADLVGFTPLSSQVSPTELVRLLDRIFSTFDKFVEKYRLEKIKTIGDAYMVAGGLPEPKPDHLEAIADMA